MLYYVITAIVALFAGLAIGVAVGIRYRKKVAEAAIGSAELQAKKIIADGMNQAKSDAAAAKKEALNLIPAGVQFPLRIQKAMASNPIIRIFNEKINIKTSDVTQSLQYRRKTLLPSKK